MSEHSKGPELEYDPERALFLYAEEEWVGVLYEPYNQPPDLGRKMAAAHEALALLGESRDKLRGLLAGQVNCGSSDMECPMQDAHKPYSIGGLVSRIDEFFEKVGVTP